MSIELLKIAKFSPFVEELLSDRYTLHDTTTAADADALIDRVAPNVRGVVGLGVSKVPASLLQRLPNVEIVATVGVGYDGVDLEACRSRRIVVANTPDVLNDDVADVALALVLNSARGFVDAHNYLQAGKWRQAPFRLTTTLKGKRAGIVGLGKIGKEIARRLEACKLDIAYHGRREQAGIAYRYFADLREMAAGCDYLIVACPGGKETANLIDAGVLAALGANGTLVNIARGSVVDEAALIAALQNGTIKAAALDVYANEPQVPEALIALPNVVLFPHLGSSTRETRLAMGRLTLANLDAHFAGEPVPARVI